MNTFVLPTELLHSLVSTSHHKMERYITYKNKEALLDAVIAKDDTVLDVGFWGQGTSVDDPNWPHRFLLARADEVYGIDMEFDEERLPQDASHYKKGNAEHFNFEKKFDVIIAGDIIEHLSNPGNFLASCGANLAPDGKLVLTTPNCFNLFNLTEKLSKYEPTVNSDHTMYFNYKTLSKLLLKNGYTVESIAYVYTLDPHHKESWKKKFLNLLYALLAGLTDKFMETLVVVATKK